MFLRIDTQSVIERRFSFLPDHPFRASVAFLFIVYLGMFDCQIEGAETFRLSHQHVVGDSNVLDAILKVSFEDGSSTEAWEFRAINPVTDEPSDWFRFEANELLLRQSIVSETGNKVPLRVRGERIDAAPVVGDFEISIVAAAPSPRLLISELMAVNRNGIRDGNGQRSDWIEVFNPGTSPVNLGEFSLTDDPKHLTKWNFPEGLIQPGGYQLIFAVGDSPEALDQEDRITASFKLAGSGEYLALVETGGSIQQEYTSAYPSQIPDVSFGLDETLRQRFFLRPTPGSTNAGPSFKEVLAPVLLSHQRGFYRNQILLRLSPPDLGATVRYTLDGSAPSKSHGMIYREPFSIKTTTIVRLVSFKSDALPSEIQTHSYLFLEEITSQGALPEGYPDNWGQDSEVPGRSVVADYEMDPRVVENTLPGYSVTDALLDLPSLSVTLPVDDLFGSSRGIYSHPRDRGNGWERNCSLEWIDPQGGEGFQVNSQIEIHGNSSRRPWRMQKHSFRLTFLASLGTDRLRFPLFRDSPVSRFNKLILRACFTDSWGLVSWGPNRYRPNDSQYIRDIWMKESFREMGHQSSHGDWAHLYLNGLYWGIYNITERLDEDFFADHLGGEPEDWEIAANFSGNTGGWSRLLSQLRDLGEFSRLEPLEAILDIENFIDYMLLHFYADSEDWPHQNGYAARNATLNKPFQFYVWDQEIALDNHRMQRYSSNQRGSPGEMFQLLRRNHEFRRRFADRVNHHLFGQGGLRLTDSQNRYSRIAQRIDKAIVAESARWGDTQSSTPYGNRIQQPSNSRNVDDPHFPMAPNGPDYYFTREDSWLVERDNVIENYLPAIYDTTRSDSLLSELRSNRLYPDLSPPIISPDGGVATSFEVTLAAPGSEEIYYTLDGTDPQSLASAEIEEFEFFNQETEALVWIPTSSEPGREWVRSSFNHAQWFPGPNGVGFESTGVEYTPWINIDVEAMRFVTASIYIRIPFVLESSTLEKLRTLTLQIRYNDGFVAFLNGERVAEANAPLGIRWNSSAKQGRSKSDATNVTTFNLSDHLASLNSGENMLAIQGLNASASSPELLISPQLTGEIVSTPNSPSEDRGIRYTGPIQINQSATLKARSQLGSDWSPLSTATFFVGIPATAENLVISEIYYHPSEHPDAEFIRLQNIHPSQSINLSNIAFTQGIQFIFGKGLHLAPDESVVIVKSEAVFRQQFGSDPNIAGEYQGSLNNGGETLQLFDAERNSIAAFIYNDDHPWPIEAGGLGSGLRLRAPKQRPNPNDPKNWRAQAPLSGDDVRPDSPGRPANGEDDSDRDGLSALLEYALGTSDADPKSGPNAIAYSVETLEEGPDDVFYFFLQFQTNPDAPSTDIIAELSSDLNGSAWTAEPLLPFINDQIGSNWKSFRTKAPISSAQQMFIRLRVE